jgi:hypothetical protein
MYLCVGKMGAGSRGEPLFRLLSVSLPQSRDTRYNADTPTAMTLLWVTCFTPGCANKRTYTPRSVQGEYFSIETYYKYVCFHQDLTSNSDNMRVFITIKHKYDILHYEELLAEQIMKGECSER